MNTPATCNSIWGSLIFDDVYKKSSLRRGPKALVVQSHAAALLSSSHCMGCIAGNSGVGAQRGLMRWAAHRSYPWGCTIPAISTVIRNTYFFFPEHLDKKRSSGISAKVLRIQKMEGCKDLMTLRGFWALRCCPLGCTVQHSLLPRCSPQTETTRRGEGLNKYMNKIQSFEQRERVRYICICECVCVCIYMWSSVHSYAKKLIG